MAADRTYIERLQLTIAHLHQCDCQHRATVPVTEHFRGELVWTGDVEVFDLHGHPKAGQCYGWSYTDDAGRDQFITVLHLPPVDSPVKAVQAAVVSQHRKQK